MIPFVRGFDFAHGRQDPVSPRIQRVVCANPGPFTFTGTGTYLVGRDGPGAGVAVIDPGPMDEAHLAALLAAVAGREVTHVLVTHTHRDHSPLARPFATAVGAPILAARPPEILTPASGARDEVEDPVFAPDRVLVGGETPGPAMASIWRRLRLRPPRPRHGRRASGARHRPAKPRGSPSPQALPAA